MFDLVEGTYATGNGAFRAGRDFTPDHDDSESEAGEESPSEPASREIDPQLLDESEVCKLLISDDKLLKAARRTSRYPPIRAAQWLMALLRVPPSPHAYHPSQLSHLLLQLLPPSLL